LANETPWHRKIPSGQHPRSERSELAGGAMDAECAVGAAADREDRRSPGPIWPAISGFQQIRSFRTPPNSSPTRGYVAKPEGSSFVDLGVGGFLAKGHPLSQPSSVDARWLPLARDNQARFHVPTLRNVDKRPYPTFVKANGHNGYFKSLKSIVHFYNTREVLARCRPNDRGEGVTCWPAPESTDNMNTTRRAARPFRRGGKCAGQLYANAHRRFHATRSAIEGAASTLASCDKTR
jgi:hypothetical protein